jgi:hypothetical protein
VILLRLEMLENDPPGTEYSCLRLACEPGVDSPRDGKIDDTLQIMSEPRLGSLLMTLKELGASNLPGAACNEEGGGVELSRHQDTKTIEKLG